MAFVVVGCAGVRAEASQEEEQEHAEVTEQEQGDSGGAAPEGDRCERTRTIVRLGAGYLTNDLPGCPNKGGLLSAQLPDIGRNKISDPIYGLLRGEKGDDEIRGSSTRDCRGYPCPAGDEIYGGDGDDVIYGFSGWDWIVGDNGDDVIHAGDGTDVFLSGGKGDDVIYGGDGNDDVGGDQGEDVLYGGDGNDLLTDYDDEQRDKLYCGAGRDKYQADPNDYVDSSCEKKYTYEAPASASPVDRGQDVPPFSASASPVPVPHSGGPAILPLAAALLLGSGILTYAILRRR